MVLLVLAVSLTIQVLAAVLALRLIRVTRHWVAWGLIAAAILLMAVRRGLTLLSLVNGAEPGPLTPELVALVISTLMAVGIHGIHGVFVALRESEERLRHSEKMQAIGDLSAGVAHDFNNLLTSIVGYASLLEIDEAVPEEQRGLMRRVKQSGLRGAELVKRLLAFARPTDLEVRVHDLNDLVEETLPLVRRIVPASVELRFDRSAEPAWAKVDAARFEQVVLNMASNARDAMPDGGALTIEVSSGRTRVVLRVRDDGTGMSEHVRARVFEPFFSTKEIGAGTGLGLASVRRFAEDAGGVVEVETELGAGSTFALELPAAEAPPMRAREEEAPTELRTIRDGAVVVVDDDELVLRSVTGLLTASGVRVHATLDGDEAIRLAEVHADEVHTLLTDSVMPKKSGASVARAVRARCPDVRVVYMTGYADRRESPSEADRESTVLHKPFTLEELLTALFGESGRARADGET